MTMMHHQGYEAVIEYDKDAEVFHGEIINLPIPWRTIWLSAPRVASRLRCRSEPSLRCAGSSRKKFRTYVANHENSS